MLSNIFLEAYYLASYSVSSPLHRNLNAADVMLLADSTKKFFMLDMIESGSLFTSNLLRSYFVIGREKSKEC